MKFKFLFSLLLVPIVAFGSSADIENQAITKMNNVLSDAQTALVKQMVIVQNSIIRVQVAALKNPNIGDTSVSSEFEYQINSIVGSGVNAMGSLANSFVSKIRSISVDAIANLVSNSDSDIASDIKDSEINFINKVNNYLFEYTRELNSDETKSINLISKKTSKKTDDKKDAPDMHHDHDEGEGHDEHEKGHDGGEGINTGIENKEPSSEKTSITSLDKQTIVEEDESEYRLENLSLSQLKDLLSKVKAAISKIQIGNKETKEETESEKLDLETDEDSESALEDTIDSDDALPVIEV